MVHGNMQSVVVSSSRDYTIRLWDARLGGEALSSLEGHMNEVTTVQWHRNGHFVLSAGRDNQLKVGAAAFTPDCIWPLASCATQQSLAIEHKLALTRAACHPEVADGRSGYCPWAMLLWSLIRRILSQPTASASC